VSSVADEKVSKYYKSVGPNLVNPTPQRTPFILQAGASKAGQEFAAAHAEAMFLPGMVPEKTRPVVDSVKAQLRKIGRPESSVKFIAGIFICVDETDEKAQAKFEDLLQYADLEGGAALFGGWSGTDLDQFAEAEVCWWRGVAVRDCMLIKDQRTSPSAAHLRFSP